MVGHYNIRRSEHRPMETVKQIFHKSNIKFTYVRKKQLEAAPATKNFKITYVTEKVEEWCKGKRNLSKLAKPQPHSAYISEEQHKSTYSLQTIEGMNKLNKVLDKITSNTFLTSVFAETQ